MRVPSSNSNSNDMYAPFMTSASHGVRAMSNKRRQWSISVELDNPPFEIDSTQKQEIMVEHV